MRDSSIRLYRFEMKFQGLAGLASGIEGAMTPSISVR
jgi:hypothetical protein